MGSSRSATAAKHDTRLALSSRAARECAPRRERESVPAISSVHIHGSDFSFGRSTAPTRNRAWKDTVLLPAGATVDLLVEMTNPGRWMLHCHIAEHLSANMMMAFTVE